MSAGRSVREMRGLSATVEVVVEVVGHGRVHREIFRVPLALGMHQLVVEPDGRLTLRE